MSAVVHSLPDEAQRTSDFHRISLFVKNEPGVLARVAMVFSRRGYNIEASWSVPPPGKGIRV